MKKKNMLDKNNGNIIIRIRLTRDTFTVNLLTMNTSILEKKNVDTVD